MCDNPCELSGPDLTDMDEFAMGQAGQTGQKWEIPQIPIVGKEAFQELICFNCVLNTNRLDLP